MAQYCDSKKLEKNWFNWLLASHVPELDEFRRMGILWTKVIGRSTDKEGNIITNGKGQTFPDACAPKRLHCLALGKPVYFSSNDGKPSSCTIGKKGPKRSLEEIKSEINLNSDSAMHDLDNTFSIQFHTIPSLEKEGYIMEKPEDEVWDYMLTDINNMCLGIASKFNPPSEEEHHDLANEAIIQVCKKLKEGKLVYTPGRAPVFNLLTTTIFRCMYSICNRKKQQRIGSTKFVDDAKAGSLSPDYRSFRIVSGKSPSCGNANQIV